MSSAIRRLNSAHALIGACVVAVGVWRFPWPSLDVRISTAVLFEICVALCLVAAIARVSAWAAAIVAMCTISMGVPEYTRHSYMAFQAVLYGSIWAVAVYGFGKRASVLDAMCIAALVNVFYAAFQVIGIDPIFASKYGADRVEVVGLMGNKNLLSALLAITLPAFFRKRWLWGIPPVVAGLLAAKSMGGIVSAGAAVAVYLWCLKARLTLFGFAALVVPAVIYWIVIDAPGLDRWYAWQAGVVLGAKHWILGAGIGHWKVVFANVLVELPRGQQVHWTTAHNEFVQVFFEMGVIGLVAVLGYCVRCVAVSVRMAVLSEAAALYVAGMAGMLANCLVNFPLHVAPTAMLCLCWVALFERVQKVLR